MNAHHGINVINHNENGNSLEANGYSLTWNDENRLVGAEKAGDKKLEFLYDFMGRRRVKKVYGWALGGWVLEDEIRFVYNEWNLITEFDGNDSLMFSYVWGADLSGREQLTGGIGGLLKTGNSYPAYNANGNVTAYFKADSSIESRIEYSPFGKVVSETGSAPCSFKFSTKYADETGLLYYGFRYYDSISGRWISRDPIEEKGGWNLYAFVSNNSINSVDRLGNSFGDLLLQKLLFLNAVRVLLNVLSAAKEEANNYYRTIKMDYECCCKNVVTGDWEVFTNLDKYYPLCVHPDAGNQIPHCMIGVAMKKRGISKHIKTAANYGYEFITAVLPWYNSALERKPWSPYGSGYFNSLMAWANDTIHDIEAVDDGYDFKDEFDDCIPSECNKM